jgi:endonuclease III
MGMALALLEHFPLPRAEVVVETLRKSYEDWNEVRVAQAQELAAVLAGKGTATPEKLRKLAPVACTVRDYLQELFQKTHGLDLEFLRADPAAGAKLLVQIPKLGSYLGSMLLSISEPGEQPLTMNHVRVLDRLKLLTRTSSIKKAREAVAGLIEPKDAVRFAMAIGWVADRWCDPRKPICWECCLVEECPTGRKIQKDWKAQQSRLALQRAREEARRKVQEEKDRRRAEREAERERKRREAEAKKREREEERRKKREAAAGAKPGSKAKPKPAAKPAAQKAAVAPAPATKKAAPASKKAVPARTPAAARKAGSDGARSGGARRPTARPGRK